MENYYKLKQLLEQLYQIIDTVEKSGLKPNLFQIPLKDAFKVELHSYFLYLSAIDGQVSSAETEFMNYLFDENNTSQVYANFINENDIYSTDFEEKLPVTLQILTDIDIKMSSLEPTGTEEITYISPLFVNFYAEAGKIFLNCDGTTQSEINEYKKYIYRLSSMLTAKLDSVSKVDHATDGGAAVGIKKRGTSHTSNSAQMQTTYGPCVYKVGVDIPAGEYKVFNFEGHGYFAICSDANCDNIVRNDNFIGQAYINISHGQFLELKRCYAVPAESAPNYTAINGIYEDGEYKVGVEIPAGEYRVVANHGLRAYYAIETSSYNGDRNIISNNNFDNAAYVSVRNGQILLLRRCTLKIQ